ncbi:MAG: hypothetical protein AAFN13_17025, partial [Bacteroidota bacterium]
MTSALPTTRSYGRNWATPPALDLPDEPKALNELRKLTSTLAEEEARVDAGRAPYIYERNVEEAQQKRAHARKASEEVQTFPEVVQRMRGVVEQNAPEFELTLDGSLESLTDLDALLHRPKHRRRLNALLRVYFGRKDNPAALQAKIVGIYFCEAVRLAVGGAWRYSLAFGPFLDEVGGRVFRLAVSQVRVS